MRSRDWSDSNVTSQAPPTLSPIDAGKQASVVVFVWTGTVVPALDLTAVDDDDVDATAVAAAADTSTAGVADAVPAIKIASLVFIIGAMEAQRQSRI